MITQTIRYILSFASTHYAISMESKINKSGLSSRLIPTPSAISSGCGLSLLVPEDEIHGVWHLIDEMDPDSTSFYKVVQIGKKGTATLLEREVK